MILNSLHSHLLRIIGLSRAKVIRITAKADGSGAEVFYKWSHRQVGWFPRPCPPGCANTAKRMFKHSDPRQGHVRSFEAVPYTEHGRRQEYRYNVKYFGGDVKTFDLRCPSLPFSMSREDLLKRIGYVSQQRFHKSYFKTQPTVLSNIKRILRHRQMYGAKMPSWTRFFQQNMPQHVDDHDFQPFQSPLVRIVEDHGGPIQVRL